MRGSGRGRDGHAFHRDDGFTLMELLIVILILGVLGAIAIFATRPFQKAAVETCFDLEFISMEVVEAAERAGIDVPTNDDNPECVPIALLFANAVENPNSVVSLSQPAQQGQTMLAISAHRSTASPPGPSPVICSGSQYLADGTCTATTPGWQLHGVFNVGSGSSGRGIAVWTKLPQPDEPTVIRAAWVNPTWTQSKSLIVGVFNRPLTVTGIASNNSGTGATVTSLNLGSASGLEGPGVVIAGLATRHPSSGAGPCPGAPSSAPGPCVAYSGVSGIKKAAEQGSSVYTGMAWTPVRHGTGPYEVSATWTTSLHAVGFTIVMNLFS